MNTEHPNPERRDAADVAAGDDAALQAALAALRVDVAPPRPLWTGIEARIGMPTPLPLRSDDVRVAPLAELRATQTPMRDLWPQIEARIRQQRWRRLRTPLTAAASIAATLVVVLGLQVSPDGARPAHAPLHASSEVIAAMQEPMPTDTALRPVSTQPLTPETRALMRANLKIVANAETQLRRAIASDPDGEYLESLLATAKQQKQDLRTALAESR